MSLMAMFDTDDGSKVLSEIAEAAGTDIGTVKTALDQLCPAIALALQEKVKDDPEIADDLADLLEDNVSKSVAGEDAIVDGKAMLAELFGSQKEAKAVLAKAAPDLPAKVLASLSPIAAVTVIAAVAEQTRPMALTGAQTAMGDTTSKIIGTLVTAIISSAVRGVIRQMTSPRSYRSTSRSRTTRKTSRSSKSTSTRRKRTPTRATTRKRSTSRSRRNPSISIEDILGGLFGNRDNQE